MRREELVRLLVDGLGVRGNHIVVHTNEAALGPVDGGAAAVCAALLDAVGEGGTVLMPAFTYPDTLSDASDRAHRTPDGVAVSPSRIVFHPDLPVHAAVGPVAEAFRHVPGVLRSNHPSHSFCAWGRQARDVLSTQRDNNPLGPLKKLNVLQGQVLLLGAGLDAATVVHLAQEKVEAVSYLRRRTAQRLNAAGYAERVVLDNLPGCSAAFVRLEDLLEPSKVRSVALPNGVARRIPVRYLVRLADVLLERDPRALVCDRPECTACAPLRAGSDAGVPAAE